MYYKLQRLPKPKYYVGSHEPDQALCEKHVPKLVEAFENCKIDEVNLISKLLLKTRARDHQYKAKIGKKAQRFLDWNRELLRDNEHLDYLDIANVSALIFNIKHETREAHKNELLSLENAGLEHEFRLVDRGEVSRADLVNTARCAFSIVGEKVPDPERGGEQVWQGHTMKSHRRREATRAVLGPVIFGRKSATCLEVGAAALDKAIARRAGDSATLAADALVAVARALDAAAKDLHAAPRRSDESEEAHMMYRVADCRWRAACVAADASGDAAVASARSLVEASKAIDAAAKAVVDAVDSDAELVARRDLAAAEAAFESLYDPAKARRPRPTSRAARRRPQQRVVASQAARRVRKDAALRPRPTSRRSPSSNNASSRRRRSLRRASRLRYRPSWRRL